MKQVIFFLTIFFAAISQDAYAVLSTPNSHTNSRHVTSMADPIIPNVKKNVLSAQALQSVAIFYEVSNACEGADLQLFAYGKGRYQWTGPNGFVSNELNPVIRNVTDAQSGIYRLKVIDHHGNENVTTTSVKINKVPQINAWASAYNLCEGDILQLFSHSNVDGVWYGPNGFISTDKAPVFSYATRNMSGVYSYTAVNAMGCASTTYFDVRIRPSVQARANWFELKDGMGLSQVLLEANGGNSYEWTGPNGFVSSMQKPLLCQGPQSEGTYQVIITNKNGCQTAVKINVDLDEPTHKIRTIRPDFYLGRA